jgi:anti-sigma regulatory factor (Ser/Thr protein kinase)
MNVCRCDQSAEAVAAVDNRSRFACTVAADASGAARIRNGFADWLHRHFSLSAERRSGVVLAIYEALANAAEFGYLDAPGHGTIAFAASYDDDLDTLAVTVTDRGRWRPAGTATVPPHHALRGRGIPLMRALADETRIDPSEHGTQACLTWTNLRRRPRERHPASCA